MRDSTPRRRDLAIVVGLAIAVVVLMALAAFWMYWVAPALLL